MRIGIVCPYDLGLRGGVQQIAVELAQHLSAVGEDVVVVGPGISPDLSERLYRTVGRSVRINANGSRAPVALSPAAWIRTLRAIGGVDVVHVHEPFIPVVGWAALSLRSQPKVVTFHADPPRWARALYTGAAFMGEWAMRGVVTTATSIVAASAVPRRWGSPIVIPNGVAVDSFLLDVDRIPTRVAFLGRDEPRKGLDVILRAWPEIIEAHPGAELTVMGASRDQGPRGIRFMGPVSGDEKRQILCSSSVFVAPNLGGESFGIVVAEAMAAGCAIVASDIPAFASVLGDAGRLVAVGDPAAIAKSVNDLLSDRDTTAELGNKARAEVARFDWSVVLEGYRDAYRRALAM